MKAKKKLPRQQHRRTTSLKAKATHAPQPFIEHLYELRRRIYYVLASVLVWAGAAYAIQQHVVTTLLRPAHGQHFIYTSPGGGVDFLFRVCVYIGLILSTPVIIYNLLGFVEPLMSQTSKRFILFSSVTCGLLALAGVFFGYFIGLPAALHFLLHQFTTVQIKPLVTIQSYLSFVIAYMLGSALLFQLPIIIVSINRIKPLKPQQLLHYERWVILAAFVLAGLMNPTPNIFSQLLVAGPFILAYQLSILLIAAINRPRKFTAADQLRQQDVISQAQRQAKSIDLQPLINYNASLSEALIPNQTLNSSIQMSKITNHEVRSRLSTAYSRHQMTGSAVSASRRTQRDLYQSFRRSRPNFMPAIDSVITGNKGLETS